MINFFILNFLLALFLLTTIFETKIKLTYTSLAKPTKFLFSIVIFLGIILSFPLFLSSESFISKYLTLVFILLIAGHFLFLSINQKFWTQVLFFGITTIVLLYHGLRITALSQDLFILFAFVWLGPFLVKKQIVTIKKAMVILGLWIAYSVIFIFFRSTNNNIFQTTQILRMPFSVIAGNSYLGIVDIVIPNLLISILKVNKVQFLGVAIFLISNLLVGLLAFQYNLFVVFPISVAWILLDIPLLFLDSKLYKTPLKI